ncbi:hypothetical protein [Chelativorans sp. M5D2P16]|uniref:D-apionate lactonase n=1 Tax=Chelativorans sp. M5D2P16 TaxID=3095678 RepID=UPI002ACAB300|nr:hypothetical protein [Chelativorans sp. M5D2P16]MDZ5696519.1 hypothetical protein [Chelativorans sp. M5D2P16]
MAPEAEEALRLYGTAVPPTPCRILRAGALEARLEGGNLRYLRYDGHEVLRAVSYVVRDQDWGTLQPEIDLATVEENEDGFRVTYRGTCVNGDARLAYGAEIRGTADGRLRFSVDAVPEGDFDTNRCGFNVLHPITGLAGAPVTVEHCDGSVESTVFPELIDPWQPFKSIRAITHEPAPHLKATCRMEGDVFEMEDQRNWSDASYKTYVRPLELPWPYTLHSGVKNSQSVEVVVAAKRDTPAPVHRSPRDARVRIDLGGTSHRRFPDVGLVIAPEEVRDALSRLEQLRAVGPQAILCHFDPTAGHGPEALADFAALQQAYPARYELEYVAVCAGDLDAEMQTLARQVREMLLALSSIAVCPAVDRQSTPPGSVWPDCPPLEAVYAAAREAFPGLLLGGGMFSYFTELNRKRPPVDMLDFVTHATNPIVHAADDESVMETLETLPHITRSVRAIIGAGKRYRLGPSTIAMRQNPYGSRTFANPNAERLCMADDDPRQRGLFAAAWTVGYAAAIAPAGIERWVPAGFTGPRGLIDRRSGALLPVGQAVADLARCTGAPLIDCRTASGRVAAIAAEAETGPAVVVANLTPQPITVDFGPTHELAAFETRVFR